MPQIASRYLLFLKYSSATRDYALMTGYELRGSQVYRLDERKFEEDNHQRVGASPTRRRQDQGRIPGSC